MNLLMIMKLKLKLHLKVKVNKMAEVKINKKEIEEMIKDQFDITKVKWDDKGNIIIDVDMDKLTEVKVVKEKQVEIIPIYKERYVRRDVYPYPYWRPNLITCKTTPQRQTLSYCKG